MTSIRSTLFDNVGSNFRTREDLRHRLQQVIVGATKSLLDGEGVLLKFTTEGIQTA